VPTIEELLSKGVVKLPRPLGGTLDPSIISAAQTISSGVSTYTALLSAWKSAQRFFGESSSDTTPKKALFIANSLLKRDVVELPPYMGGEDIDILRNVLTTGLGFQDPIQGIGNIAKGVGQLGNSSKGPRVISKQIYDVNKSTFAGTNAALPKDRALNVESGTIKVIKSSSESDSFFSTTPDNYYEDFSLDVKESGNYRKMFEFVNPVEWLKSDEKINKLKSDDGEVVSTAYDKVFDPYGECVDISTPAQIKRYLTEDLSFGYQRWAGFELGTDHLWDIRMEPYIDHGGSYLKEFPTYRVPRVGANGVVKVAEFDFGKYLPVVAYSLSFGNQVSKDIPLYNSSSMQFPVGFSYNIVLTLDIVDDVFHSMKNYINQSMNAIYNLDRNEVAVYYQAAWLVDLVIYKPGFEKSYRVKLIGCPVNYSFAHDGQSEPSAAQVHLELAIVGMKSYTNIDVSQNPIGKNDWAKGVNWTEVTLNPNGGVVMDRGLTTQLRKKS
jgi:hypothetical protein